MSKSKSKTVVMCSVCKQEAKKWVFKKNRPVCEKCLTKSEKSGIIRYE